MQRASGSRVPIRDLPHWAQAPFKGYDSLNVMQSKMMQKCLFSSDNLLLCAPTGAGKTNVAVMSILHEIGMHLKEGGRGKEIVIC